MNATNSIKRLMSMLLAFAFVFTMLPLNVMAANSEPIVLIAGGDYQQAGDHANSSDNVSNILDQVVSAGFSKVDGFLFVGDYDCETHDDSSQTSAGIKSLMDTMTGVYSNLNYTNTILVQGNHDYPDSKIDATGGHDFDGYSVFVMNEDDYPNYGGSESQAKSLADDLDTFLAEKLNDGSTAPIFVTSHVPLHFGPRTNRQGDGKYASYIFDVLNSYGAEGLNIIFMHGHNHAYGYDEYLGGEAIYLAVGDEINIAKTGSQSSYNTYTLNFTYMNAGYTGYYNESGYSTSTGTDFLTMTTFQIYDDEVVINRFSEDGLYNMKSAGQKKGDYINSVSVSANTSVYASAQTVTLNAPAERVTLEDANTGITVTGLKVEGSFEDDSDLIVSENEIVDVLENDAKYAAYEAYDMSFEGSGSMTVVLPVPSSYSAFTTKVYYVDGDSLTDMDAVVNASSSGMTASFSTTHDGIYAVVNEVLTSTSYVRVDSVNDLVSGEEYLIVFDCSSQTTADAFVIPDITSYNSGSSLRKGADVVVSDGIADDEIIVGEYDDYLWTLTESGSNWLIGNGSKNIDVTYNSTTSRCELDFASSGEALNIATGSSNPSDANSYSFAIYDSDDYYWQYNTSATLIYGTDGDDYRSRFCFYQKVESAVDTPDTSDAMYVLDTDGIEIGEEHKYILVGSDDDYALTLSGSTIDAAKVTVSGNVASVSDPSICEFYFVENSKENNTYLLTQDGSKTVYHANGNMYYGSDSKGYWYIGSGSNGEYKIYDYDNMNWYLNYGYVWGSEATSRFAVSSTSRTLRLFKLNDGHEHNYEMETIDATCTEAGSVTYTCSVCGDSYTETVEALGHKYNAVTVDATCSAEGSVTYTCSVCGDSYVEAIPATGEHSYESTVIDATCTEAGSVTYTCTCGDTYSEIIEAEGHAYTAVTVDATCSAEGSVTYTCSVCGDSYVEAIPATGDHTYESTVIDASCTEAGSVIYTCSVCGDSYTETVEALGHKYNAVTVDATCIENGSVTYTCTCGDTYSEIVEAKGHAYTAVVTEATCTDYGYTTHTCTACGDSYIDNAIIALGHNYETVTVEPTCTEAGYTVSTCARCGENGEQTEIAALGHAYVSEIVAATCTESGHTVHTCERCDDSYTDSVTEALGHNYNSAVTAPTCEEEGYTTHTCSVCGESSVDSYTDALGHNYETVTVEATCSKEGSHTHTCTACGDSYVEAIAMVAHSYKAVVTEATCIAGGYTTYTCEACSSSYVADETVALDHSYTAVEDNGYMVYTCDRCGDSYSESLAVSYSYGKVSKFTSGENYVITLYSNRKYYALSHEGNQISAVQVAVSNNEITSEVTEDMLWSYNSNKLSYVDNGTTYYLYAGSSNSWWGGWFGSATLSVSSSNSSSVSISGSKVKVGSYYLRYSSGNITVNRSAGTSYLYQQTED